MDMNIFEFDKELQKKYNRKLLSPEELQLKGIKPVNYKDLLEDSYKYGYTKDMKEPMNTRDNEYTGPGLSNLQILGAKISRLASKNPKMLIVLLISVISIASYYTGYQKGKELPEGMTQKLIIAAIGGALSVGLLAMGYKLIRHVCSKSAAEVAASDKPKEQKLKTLNGLLNAAQKAVSKAKTTDDKALAQASVDIIQRHINTVQNQA